MFSNSLLLVMVCSHGPVSLMEYSRCVSATVLYESDAFIECDLKSDTGEFLDLTSFRGDVILNEMNRNLWGTNSIT